MLYIDTKEEKKQTKPGVMGIYFLRFERKWLP